MKKILLASLFTTTQVFAWGPTGHRAVGEVAQSRLKASVAAKVQEILGGAGLARVSTWPDEIKSEPETYRHTNNWHYTDWPDEMHDHNEENSSGRLLTSISEQLKVLKDAGSPKDKKAFALKFLTHLIGDLHQPLHVGNGLDQGGNNCKVIFQGNATNLHALWDEEMLNFSKLSFTEMAKFVAEGVKPEEIRDWERGTPEDWAAESKAIRNGIYPQDQGASTAANSVHQYCRKDITLPQAELPKLGYDYSYKFMPVVERRIFQAGLRLAVLLNDAF